jgi:hydrogenase-4 component F
MVAGSVPAYQRPVNAAHVPVILHMVLVFILGVYLPDFLNQWFHTAVELLK